MSMSVSIPLKKIDGRATYELRLDLREAEGSVSSLEQHSTAAALLGFFDEKARTDQDLSQELTQHLRYRRDDETGEERGVEAAERQENIKYAELMGRRIRDIGDEFMVQIYRNPRLSALVDSMVDESAEKSAAQNAYEHFCEVANILLWSNGHEPTSQITVGRIAALFSYCYHLCKVFMERNGVQGVVKFLGRLLGYLIRCLYKSKFYEWLSSQGGWVQLVKQTYQISSIFITHILLGGALLLGFIAYKYINNR